MNEYTLHLYNPWMLLLTAVPVIYWGVIHTMRRRRDDERYAEKPLLRALLLHSRSREHIRLPLIAWLLASLAAAGPEADISAEPPPQLGGDIAVVLDISPSMNAEDSAPSRLQRAKWEIEDLLTRLPNHRFALIAFSANAYVALPLTRDHAIFLRTLNAIDSSVVATPGSNLPRALSLVAQVLRDSPHDARAVILASDGEAHSADDNAASSTLRDLNIPVFALALGSETGAPALDANGQLLVAENQPVISYADPGRLGRITATTGGAVVVLADDDSDTQRLTQALAAMQQPLGGYTTNGEGLALYPWLIAAALVVCVWLITRRPEALATIILAPVLLAPDGTHASPWSERDAYAALQRGDYATAAAQFQSIDGYNAQLGAGAAFYRLGKWGEARAAYQRAIELATSNDERATATYNLGNALARMESFPAAAAAYREALRWQPNLSRAALNLNLIDSLIAEQQSPQTSQGQSAIVTQSQNDAQGGETEDDQGRNARSTDDALESSPPRSSPSTTATLAAGIADDAHTLLQKRFAQRDTQDTVSTSGERPW